MSFFSSDKNIRPGPIEGNPLHGLEHRVAITARRVLDSCITQEKNNPNTLVYTIPVGFEEPVTFVGATSTQTDAPISNLCVSRLERRRNFARVTCDVTIPLLVSVEDARGRRGTSTSSVKIPMDVVMFMPQPSIFPFEITACASYQSTSGTCQPGGRIQVTGCITIITRVVAETDILIPAYGQAPVHDAISFAGEACSEVFDLPLYPRGEIENERRNCKC